MKKAVREIFENYRNLSLKEKENHRKNELELKKKARNFEEMKKRNDKWFSKL